MVRPLTGLPVQDPAVPHFEMEWVRPEVHKWYAPRHLMESYARPWYITDTNYAREFYSRYLDKILEGQDWYDTFGHPLGRGWLVYTWKQEQVQRNGSLLSKGLQGFGRTNAYANFFQQLVIAADGDGRGTYRLMVGDEIFTAFTPLTFYKPRFNGLRLDYATDRQAGSLILSRPSSPDGGNRTNTTHLVGGHASFQVSDGASLGFTYVNAHNAQTQVDFTYGNPLRGTLTTAQNQPLDKLWVRLRDDSPEDRQGGAALFRHEIVLVDSSGRKIRGSDIGFRPRVEGGARVEGDLVADGLDTILLEYDLGALDHEGLRSTDLRRVWVELDLANDYRVELASNLQTGGDPYAPEIIFLTKKRASGHVQDHSNGGVIRVDYGLPTANELIGMDWDWVSGKGLSVQGEVVVNNQYSKYPGLDIAHHHLIVDRAYAGYVRVGYNHYPWGFFGEGFSMDDGYSTRYWLTRGSGEIRYKAPVPELYEFVEDDDDHNAIPEWERPFQPSSREVAWPGYDENRDLRYDYNQNGNLIPDYEEPFLRFRSDRPEFLFGLDMNYNGAIDRFENDDLPDYPYKKDHRGFNAYVQSHIGPDLRLFAGLQRVELIYGNGRTRAAYVLGAWSRSLARGGRLRLFEFGALIRDDIPDDLQQWVQPVGGLGRVQDVVDEVAFRNTWQNVLYADWDQWLGEGVRLQHRFKWEGVHQRDDREELRRREGRRQAGFVGLINRAEWSLPVGLGLIEPRWKSEFRHDRPYSQVRPTATSLEETALLLWTQPLLAERVRVGYFPRYGRQTFATELQTGLELTRFWMLHGRRDAVDQDFRSWVWVVQLTNRTAYQGYHLVTRVGMQWRQIRFPEKEDSRTRLLFVTIHGGMK